ncbi:hypothetical protein TDB9533_04766 [Thalassocella blandensis]|nr:hypothetical protein TDB9533_04766 [Thalassocella blandensis]
MEFGENWLKPIDDRIKKEYPMISSQRLAELSEIINDTRDYGLKLVLECIEGSESQDEAFEKLENGRENIFQLIRERVPGISEENVNKVYSQSIYYSRK